MDYEAGDENAHDCDVEIEELNTDGRDQYSWKSKYEDKKAKWGIFLDSLIVFFFFVISVFLLVINSQKTITIFLGYIDEATIETVQYLLYFSFAGLLGGTTFGMKYFYRVVARGYWTADRRIWRLFSPLIALVIGFIVGCMSVSGILFSWQEKNAGWAIAVGFVAGYFADRFVGVLVKFADTLFGKEDGKDKIRHCCSECKNLQCPNLKNVRETNPDNDKTH